MHQYRRAIDNFSFNEVNKKQSTKKIKVKVHEESVEVKFEHVYQQLMNDIYAKIEDGESLSIDFIQSALTSCLLKKFNREMSAKIMGISVRTLRNYIKKYGHKNIQQNKIFLH